MLENKHPIYKQTYRKEVGRIIKKIEDQNIKNYVLMVDISIKSFAKNGWKLRYKDLENYTISFTKDDYIVVLDFLMDGNGGHFIYVHNLY